MQREQEKMERTTSQAAGERCSGQNSPNTKLNLVGSLITTSLTFIFVAYGVLFLYMLAEYS